MLIRTYNLISIFAIIASLFSCSDTIGTMQDFKNNKYPEILSFTSNPSGAIDLDPNTPVTLTVTAMDPEGEPLRFTYNSEDGSFADQIDTADTSTVTFYSASYLTTSQTVRASVKVTDDKKFSVSQDIEIGSTRSGPSIISVGDIPVYISSDSAVNYSFYSSSSGLYKVQVDGVGPATYFYGAMETATITVAGAGYTGTGDAKMTAGTDGDSDVIAVILQDTLGNPTSKTFTLTVDNTAPVSSVNPASGTSTFSAFPVTITATDARSGVSRISYSINGADPDFSGSGTVVQGSTAMVTIGNSGIGAYTLRYRAMDNVGNIENVKSATYTIQDGTTPPGEVTLTITKAGPTSIYLSWIEPLDSDYAYLILTCSPLGTSDNMYKGSTTATMTGVSAGIEYTITAVTVDTVGNHSAGTSIKITTPPALMNVFFIPTAARLYELQQNVSYYSYYCIVTADIDLTAYSSWTPIGNWQTSFTGIFEGNNHIITKLTINNPGINNQGLFANVSGTIKNVILTGINVSGYDSVGGLAGYNQGSISGCSVSGTVSGAARTGGLVGNKVSGSITNCNTSVTVTSSGYTGGLAGYSDGSTISTCSASGTVTGTNNNTGGLIGYNTGGFITNCSSSVTVKGDGVVGGLIGQNISGAVSNCSATGSVTGTYDHAGGLIGINNSGAISNSTASGYVNGLSYTGGLIGENSGKITSCSAAGETRNNESNYSGGLIAYNKGDVTGCYATGAVFGRDLGTGGLIGYNTGGHITYCHYTVSDYSDTISNNKLGVRGVNDATGGFVGDNVSGGKIEYCYVTLDGSLPGIIYIGAFLNCGGFAGRNSGTIQYCYTTVPVIGWTSKNFGGFAGSNAGTITNCYARGDVMELVGNPGQYFGGFVGDNTGGSISYCYETGKVTGTTNAYGFTGLSPASGIQYCYYNSSDNTNGGGTASNTLVGLTLAQMLVQGNFSFFDFSSTEPPIWSISNGYNNGYPYLTAIQPPHDN
jgi:hypothetical protein